MDFAWDEDKRLRNLIKHGLDFADVAEFDWERATIVPDRRRDYGEARFRAFGSWSGLPHSIVFSPRNGRIRIISFRRANHKEIEQNGEPQT
jgi:hypothetical protein